MKNTVSGTVMFFTVPILASVVNTIERMSKEVFIPAWQQTGGEVNFTLNSASDHSSIQSHLSKIQIEVVARRRTQAGELWYYSCCVPNGISPVMIQVMTDGSSASFTLKSADTKLIPIVQQAISKHFQ